MVLMDPDPRVRSPHVDRHAPATCRRSLPPVSRVLLIIGSLSLLAATQLSALGFHALTKC